MMNRRIRALLFFFIVLSLGGLLAALSFIEREAERLVPARELDTVKRLERINFYGTEGSRRVWDLFADRGVQKRQDVILLDNIRLIHYLKDGKSTLTGRKASYYREEGILDVEGDVKVVSSNGYTLLTEFLRYSLTDKKASTSRPVTIHSERMDVEGVGLEADLSASRLKVLKEVRTVLKDVYI